MNINHGLGFINLIYYVSVQKIKTDSEQIFVEICGKIQTYNFKFHPDTSNRYIIIFTKTNEYIRLVFVFQNRRY